MAVNRGIVGFETGRVDTANMSLAGVGAVATNKPRTGTYNFRDNAVATKIGQVTIASGITVASNALYQIGLRFFVFINAMPSVAPYVLGEWNVNAFRLEMNTTGGLRLNTNLYSIGGAYTAALQTGHWYEVRMRTYGTNKNGAVANSGRAYLSVEVFDWGTTGDEDNPVLVFSDNSPAQAALPSNAVCDNASGKFDILSNGGSQSLAAIVSGFHLIYSGSTPGGCGINANGEYDIFPAQTAARGPEGGTPCTSPCTANGGSSVEAGNLNGVDVGSFSVTNSSIPGDIQFSLGNSANGAISNRDISYDDVYYDIDSGVDTPYGYGLDFPVSTFVRPFPVIAQGFYNLFTPAGSFNLVNAIPMVDTNTITAAVIDRATSYLHTDISLGSFAEHIRVYARVNGAALTQQLIVFIDPSILSTVDVTIPVGNGNVLGDYLLEFAAFMSADDFNISEYGGIVKNTGTFNIHSIFMEVLTGPTDIFLDDGTPNGANIVGGLALGDLGITQGQLILITDGSGIYTITANQFFDRLYARNAGEATVDVNIPDPTFDLPYVGDDNNG